MPTAKRRTAAAGPKRAQAVRSKEPKHTVDATVISSRVRRELRERQIDPGPLTVIQRGDGLTVQYGTFRTTLPVPSQEAIDRWWERYGSFVTGAIVALVGVVVGGKLVAPAQRKP